MDGLLDGLVIKIPCSSLYSICKKYKIPNINIFSVMWVIVWWGDTDKGCITSAAHSGNVVVCIYKCILIPAYWSGLFVILKASWQNTWHTEIWNISKTELDFNRNESLLFIYKWLGSFPPQLKASRLVLNYYP